MDVALALDEPGMALQERRKNTLLFHIYSPKPFSTPSKAEESVPQERMVLAGNCHKI